VRPNFSHKKVFRRSQKKNFLTKIEEKPGFSYFLTTPGEAWGALEYHEEWRTSKHPMNKGKLTTALYKQLDWFKDTGSKEEKKASE